MIFEVLLVASWTYRVLAYVPSCINTIQDQNLLTLRETLQQGYEAFCNADIDQGVFGMFPGSDPSDAIIEVWGANSSHTMQLKDVCKIPECGLDTNKRTLIFVNGINLLSDADLQKFSLTGSLCKKDFNMIFVDFAHNDALLYNTAKRNLRTSGYAVYRIIDVLLSSQIHEHNIILAGHSQGAQIVAIAAKYLTHSRGKEFKLPMIIAVDPAIPCNPKNQHVNSDLAQQVIVYHSNNDNKFSISEQSGTIDIYPNGDVGHQPGCSTAACSHIYALAVFLESICIPDNLVAVRCKDWHSFTQGFCYEHDVISLNLNISTAAKGKYYCVTKSEFPCGLGFKGIHRPKLSGNFP